MRRFPVLPSLAAGWLGGAVLVSWSGRPDLVAVALALAALALGGGIAVLGVRSSAWPRMWVAAALAFAAAGAGAASIARPREPARFIGVAEVELEVEGLRVERARTVTVARVVGGEVDELIGRRVALADLRAVPGALLAGRVELRPRPVFLNPTPHPSWPSEPPADLEGRVFPPGLRARRDASALAELLEGVRDHVRSALVRTLDEPALGLARALVLGEARAVERADTMVVRGAGLSHVLAVSGLHVALVIGALVWALRRLLPRVRAIAARYDPRRVAAAIATPSALVYAAFAGGAPSAWRAALTAALALGLEAMGRRPRAVEVASLAIVTLAAADPPTALRPAFLLSVLATAAILGSAPQPDAVRALAWTSARATLATAPLVLWCFGELPLLGVLANVIIVPAASLVLLPLSLVHALVASLAPELSAPSAALLELASHAFLGACAGFAEAAPSLRLPPLDVAQGLILTALAIALLASRSWRFHALALVVATLAIGLLELRLRAAEQPRGVVRATFLDVGQGDGALVDLPDGRLLVVDAGGVVGSGLDPGAHVILPLLRARRRERIDVLVISHPHPDHYGGVRALLDAMPIGEIWDTGQAEDERPDGELASMLAHARALGVVVRGPPELCGEPRELGGARVEVLWPCPHFDAGWGPNENSFVIELRFGERRFLFTGDVEEHAEGELARLWGERGAIDVLKVPHHGSRTSSSAGLLDALAPRIAVASAGRGNRFGHPHAEVVERLASRAELVRIDLEGGAVVTTDGRALSLACWSGAALELSAPSSR